MATAAEILPLRELKLHLRLPDDDDAPDAALATYTAAAIAEVESRTGIDLVDMPASRRARVGRLDCRVSFVPEIDLRSPAALRAAAWQDREGRTLSPVDLSGVDLLRRSADDLGRGRYAVVPPPGGWTTWPSPDWIEISFIVGTPAGDVPKSLKQAAILLVRDYWDGTNYRSTSEAVTRITAPYVLGRAHAVSW